MGERNKQSLQQLQHHYFQGEISQEEYRRQRREWLDALLQGASREEATVVQVHKPSRRRRWRRLTLALLLLLALGLWLARAFWLPGP